MIPLHDGTALLPGSQGQVTQDVLGSHHYLLESSTIHNSTAIRPSYCSVLVSGKVRKGRKALTAFINYVSAPSCEVAPYLSITIRSRHLTSGAKFSVQFRHRYVPHLSGLSGSVNQLQLIRRQHSKASNRGLPRTTIKGQEGGLSYLSPLREVLRVCSQRMENIFVGIVIVDASDI